MRRMISQLLIVTLANAAVRAEERWMVVMLDGKKLGHAVERVTSDAQGNTVTASEMKFGLDRMGQAISLGMASEFIEAKDGTPLRMTSTQDLGATRVVETYEFTRGFAGDEVIHVTESQGRVTRRQRPWPEGSWLTPKAARADVERRLAAGEPSFIVTTLDPSVGLTPVQTTYTVAGRESIEVLGKTVPAVRWTVTQSAMPGVVSTEFVDARGRTLRAEIQLGGMALSLLAADRDVALSAFDPPEMMARTLVAPTGVPIGDARSTNRATYVLALPEGDPSALSHVPDAGAQRVERIDERRVRVRVEAGRSSEAPAEAARHPRYIEPSTMIDAEDPAVKAITERALEGVAAGDRERAEALRRAVSDHITDAHLGVGLATASEVARTRTGDCTEHAVLLAACLRAAGIPSRLVSGVVYVDELVGARRVFGYHMWTQAVLRDEAGTPRWVDLDAAIPTPAQGGIDATHIALAATSLSEDDAMGSMAAMVGVLGRLRIEVESVKD